MKNKSFIKSPFKVFVVDKAPVVYLGEFSIKVSVLVWINSLAVPIATYFILVHTTMIVMQSIIIMYMYFIMFIVNKQLTLFT